MGRSTTDLSEKKYVVHDSDLERKGIELNYYPEKSWRLSRVVQDIQDRTAKDPVHPPKILMMGYSYGGFAVLETARKLLQKDHNISIDLAITIDPIGKWFGAVAPDLEDWSCPENIRKNLNFYETAGMPWSHEIACHQAKNILITPDETFERAHFSIASDPILKSILLKEVNALLASP